MSLEKRVNLKFKLFLAFLASIIIFVFFFLEEVPKGHVRVDKITDDKITIIRDNMTITYDLSKLTDEQKIEMHEAYQNNSKIFDIDYAAIKNEHIRKQHSIQEQTLKVMLEHNGHPTKTP